MSPNKPHVSLQGKENLQRRGRGDGSGWRKSSEDTAVNAPLNTQEGKAMEGRGPQEVENVRKSY